MTEGRHTEAGEREAHPGDNVVRLPRDWLGPREELVPFGPRAFRGADEPPPSADDFWGERSAAIHGALEAPANWTPPDRKPADRARAHPGRAGAADRHTGRRLRLPPIRVSVATLRKTAIATLSGVAVVSIAIGFTPNGVKLTRQPQREAGGFRLNEAAVLSIGVSPLPTGGLPRPRVTTAAAPAAKPRLVVHHRRRPSHTEFVAAPSHSSTPAHTAAVSYTQTAPVEKYTAPVTQQVSSETGSAPAQAAHPASHRSAPAGPSGPGAPFGPGEMG